MQRLFNIQHNDPEVVLFKHNVIIALYWMSYIKSNLKNKNTFRLTDCLFRELELDNVISGTNQPLTVVKKKNCWISFTEIFDSNKKCQQKYSLPRVFSKFIEMKTQYRHIASLNCRFHWLPAYIKLILIQHANWFTI